MKSALVGCLVMAGLSCSTSVQQEEKSANDDVRAVYSASVSTQPVARRLCGVLHELPAARFSACCHKGRLHFESECTRALSASLVAGAIDIPESRVDACERAMRTAVQGCDWVGAIPLPSECVDVVRGKLKQSSRCRSSLECEGGLFCRSAGPVDWGTCQPAGSNGVACELSVDTLASYARQPLRGRHDECQGVCERHRCGQPSKRCISSAQCLSSQHCNSQGMCVEGSFATVSQSCVPGACGGELYCLQEQCVALREAGAECTADAQCRGSCDLSRGRCVAGC